MFTNTAARPKGRAKEKKRKGIAWWWLGEMVVLAAGWCFFQKRRISRATMIDGGKNLTVL
jgi:hypothetical protein